MSARRARRHSLALLLTWHTQVLARVLGARLDMVRQSSFSDDELLAIFDSAPPARQATREPADAGEPADEGQCPRKPVEGDCPVCLTELDAHGPAASIVWCRAVCGRNVHHACMEAWAATKPPGHATCPLCRSKWQDETLPEVRMLMDEAFHRNGFANTVTYQFSGLSSLSGALTPSPRPTRPPETWLTVPPCLLPEP